MNLTWYDYYIASKVALARGRQKQSWYMLLLAEETREIEKQKIYHPRSEIQKEQQRLWQERGTLERIRATLQQLTKPIQSIEDNIAITSAIRTVNKFIAANIQQMSNLHLKALNVRPDIPHRDDRTFSLFTRKNGADKSPKAEHSNSPGSSPN